MVPELVNRSPYRELSSLMLKAHPRLLLRALAVILVLSPATASLAQSFHIETIEEADGLPSPDVKSITQDRWGIIWIATRAGLAFHNGVSWEKAPLDSLVYDVSEGHLQVDHRGELWALMSGYDPTLIHNSYCQWNKVPLPEGLGKHKVLLFSVAKVDTHVVAAIVEEPGKLYIQEGESWRDIPLQDYGISNITSMVVYENQFILATPQGAFSVLPKAPFSVQLLTSFEQTGPVLCLTNDTLDESLWLIGSDWIGKFFDGTFFLILPPQGSLFPCFQESLRPVCGADGFGGVYLSGSYGMQYFNPATGIEIVGTQNGLINDDSRDFFLDRENVVWQGTTRGISKIISRYTTGYTSKQGLHSDEVTAVLRRQDGALVLGHNNGLTIWNDDKKDIIECKKNGVHNRVLDLAEDSKGNVWIAGRQRGIGKLTLDGKLTWWSMADNTPGHYVSIVVDRQDRVWAAFGNQLLVSDKNGFSSVEAPGLPLVKGFIRRLILGYDGTIYMATGNHGLIAFKDGQTRQWKTGLKDHGNSVYDIYESPEGVTWVGTRAGLYQLDNQRLGRPSDPLYNIQRPVYFLEMDPHNRLWAGTDDGVIRIGKNRVDHFTAENGLIGRETNRCASLVEPSGKTWVGTERGLTVFDEIFEDKQLPPPLVYLVQVATDDQSFFLLGNNDKSIKPSKSSTLEFQYSVLTTRDPKRTRIQTRLDGYDSDWVDQNPTVESVVTYGNLQPGPYQFNIRAAGYQQPWSVVRISPEVILPTPTGHKLWFQFLIAITFLAALILPIIIWGQRRYNSRLRLEVQEKVAANLRIETELEQSRNLRSLGVLAGGIAHDFNNLLTIIFGNISLVEKYPGLPNEQLKQLKTANGAIERAQSLADQLLTFSPGGSPVLEVGSLDQLATTTATSVLRGSSTQCQFDFSDELWPVIMDAGQMTQVLRNLCLNAQEAMPYGGQVTFSGHNIEGTPEGLALGQYVNLLISDSGPGIDPKILSQIFDPYFSTKELGAGLGLTTAHSILAQHQGKLTVSSTLGSGTTMSILLPAGSPAVS